MNPTREPVGNPTMRLTWWAILAWCLVVVWALATVIGERI